MYSFTILPTKLGLGDMDRSIRRQIALGATASTLKFIKHVVYLFDLDEDFRSYLRVSRLYISCSSLSVAAKPFLYGKPNEAFL